MSLRKRTSYESARFNLIDYILLAFITTCSLPLRAQANQYSSIPLSATICPAPEAMMDPIEEIREITLLREVGSSVEIQSKIATENRSTPSPTSLIMDTTMHYSVSSTDGLLQAVNPNPTPEASAETGIFQGVPVAQDNLKFNKSFREDNEFNESILHHVPDADYVPTALDPSMVFRVFVTCDNRDGHIDKKIKEYEKKRLEFPSDVQEYKTYSRLISLLEEAKIYHNRLIGHLIRSVEENNFDKAASKEDLNSFQRLKLNSRPNKIERTISEIETDCKQLEAYKEKHSTLQNEQAAATANNGAPNAIIPDLQNRIQFLNNAIIHQQAFIEARCDSVQYIRPPYEELDPALKTERDQNQWTTIKERCLTQCYNLFERRIVLLAAGNQTTANYLNNAAVCLHLAAEEAQKPAPQARVIDWHERSTALFQEAVNALDLGKEEKARYLHSAAITLNLAAEEAQKPAPQARIIDRYERSAALLQEAGNALDLGNEAKTRYLNSAAIFLNLAADEAQKAEPQARIIDLYERSAALVQEILNALDAGNKPKANYLNSAAVFLNRAAEEAEKPAPQARVIDLYERSAALMQEAGNALDLSNEAKTRYLNNAAIALNLAAEEAQKAEPQAHVIDWYERSAALFQEAINALDTGNERKANYLHSAAVFLYKATEEARKPAPQARVIDWYERSTALFQEAVNALDLGKEEKARYLHSAAITLNLAAEEAQEAEPQEATINSYILLVNDLEKKAQKSRRDFCVIN